jgi:hypothetical protein
MNYVYYKPPVPPKIEHFGYVDFNKETKAPELRRFLINRGTDNRSVEVVALSLVIQHLQQHLIKLTKAVK